MKRVFLALPFIAIAFFVIGLARELSERDDSVDHFEIAPEDELHLSFDEPFGEETLQGTVTGSNGETLYDAIVYTRVGDTPCWDRTDPAGRFELKRLPPGPWRVFVVSRGYRPESFAVADGATARNLALAAPLESLPEIPEFVTATLEGRLVDANIPDANFEGYELSLQPMSPLEERTTPFPRRVVANAEGKFVLEDLAQGRYRVHVLPPWASGGVWPNLVAPDERTWSFQPSEAGSGHEIRLERGEIQGRLTDSKGAFLEGALVLVESADDKRRVWPTVSTSQEGAFLLGDLPPGRYRVRARAGAGVTEQLVEVRAGLTLNLDLDPLVTRDPESDAPDSSGKR